MNQQEKEELCKWMIEMKIPYRTISSRLKMSPNTISRISKLGPRNTLCIPGRHSIITEDMRHFIDSEWSLDATITDSSMQRRVNSRFATNLSVSTVRRVRLELKYEYRPPKVRQELTQEQKAVRLQFCDWILRHPEEAPNIVFSDESRFELGRDCQWRRIKRGAWNSSCFVERRKHPQGCMIWGAIGLKWRSELMKCSNSVNSAEYVSILEKSGLIPELDKRHGRGGWTFQQDGAPCHSSCATRQFLDSRSVRLLAGWPANSPDLNPIEMLWGVMKRRVRGVPAGANIFETLKVTWQMTEEETIDKMVTSFFDRCRLVLRLNGESAGPWLASHRSPPPFDPELRIWTPADEDRLIEMADRRIGWQRIAETIGVSIRVARHRHKMIMDARRNKQCEYPTALPGIGEFQWDASDFQIPDDLIEFLELVTLSP